MSDFLLLNKSNSEATKHSMNKKISITNKFEVSVDVAVFIMVEKKL